MSKARNIADLGSNDVLDTNANGVTVTGSLTADGLTVETTADNGAVIEAHDNLTTTYPLKVQNAAGTGRLEIGTYGINNNIDLKIQTADTNRINVDTNGDIIMYRDDGTTAGVTFDASTGYTTFDGYVTVNNSVDLNGTLFPNSIFMADSQAIVFGTGSDAELSWGGSYLNLNTKGNDIRIMDGLTTKIHYDASSNSLGIGIDNPDEKLHIKNGALKVEDANNPIIILRDEGNSSNEIGVSGRGAGQDSIYISAYNALANNTYDFKINGATGSIQTRSSLEVGTRIISQQSRINDGTSLAGGMFVEKDVTGSGSSNDISIFADGITNGGNIHFMSGGSANVRLTVDSSGYVTTPYQPSWNLRPNTASNITHTSDIIGWTTNNNISSNTLCHLQGVTLSGSSSGVAGATSSGRINFPVTGAYKIWITIRYENTVGQGNIYLLHNGTLIGRQHAEVWGRYSYAHAFMSQVIRVSAGDYIEWQLDNPGNGILQGYNDTVNWCGGYLIG